MLPHKMRSQRRARKASPRFARLRHSMYDGLWIIGMALREQGAGGFTAQGLAVAGGRQCRGFGRCATETKQGWALRFTCGRAHLPPFAHSRSPLVCSEPSPAPSGRNRAQSRLRLPARFAHSGKRALPLVPLAALPLLGLRGLLPPAPALPPVSSSVPLLRCAPCSLLCVYICELFTFINVNFTFVNCSRI